MFDKSRMSSLCNHPWSHKEKLGRDAKARCLRKRSNNPEVDAMMNMCFRRSYLRDLAMRAFRP